MFKLGKTGERFEEYTSAQVQWSSERYQEPNWSYWLQQAVDQKR